MRTYDVDLGNNSLGTAVRQAREEINYTVSDLAETCGLAADEIIEIESGTCLDGTKLGRIAAVLSLSTEKYLS